MMHPYKICFYCLILLPLSISYPQKTPLHVTAGRSIFRTNENKVYMETLNNQRPTLTQNGVALIADRMIYDENDEIGYAYGNLRFVDLKNKTFLSADEGTYNSKEQKIILRKSAEILLEKEDGSSLRIVGKIITIYPDDSYIIVQGNIELDDGDTRISGKELHIWMKSEKMVILGQVQSLSEKQKLITDKLSMQFKDGELQYYTADGNVIAVSIEDKMTIMAGFLSYDLKKQLMKAIKNPSIYFHSQSTISYANVIEFDQNTNMGSLLGDVVSIQNEGEQMAYSRWALYNGEKKTISMFGNPRLEQADSEVFGTEILVDVDKNTMNILSGGRGFFKKGD